MYNRYNVKIDKSWFRRRDNVPEHNSSAAIIIRNECGVLYLALVRELGHFKYFLPKGRVDEGEEPVEAAKRETREEAGLTKLKLIKKIGTKERMTFDKKEWKRISYYLFITSEIDGVPEDKEHNYFLCWFKFDSIPELLWPEEKDILENNRKKIITALIGKNKNE